MATVRCVTCLFVIGVLIAPTRAQCQQECDFYPWVPWDCTNCAAGTGTQNLAYRQRGICCLMIRDPYACMNSCNYTLSDVEEYGPCITYCNVVQNTEPQTTDTNQGVTIDIVGSSIGNRFETTTGGSVTQAGPCYTKCIGLTSRESCLRDCLGDSHSSDICTILAISLFILGVIIGAITTAIIVRCCSRRHDNAHAQKRRSKKGRTVVTVQQRTTNDPSQHFGNAISTPQKEKRELRRVLEQTKNRGQVSPFSSSTNLMESDWSRGSGEDSPGVPGHGYRNSVPSDHMTEPLETTMKPSFFVGARPLSMVVRTPEGVVRTPEVPTRGHVGNTDNWSKQPRGNIWLAD